MSYCLKKTHKEALSHLLLCWSLAAVLRAADVLVLQTAELLASLFWNVTNQENSCLRRLIFTDSGISLSLKVLPVREQAMLSGGTHSSLLGRDLRVLLLLAVGRRNTLICAGNLAEKKY